MKKTTKALLTALATLMMFAALLPAAAAAELPTHEALQSTLKAVVSEDNGGFGFNMWVTMVNRGGVVKAVAFSGENQGDQWPGSRIISAQKSNTANAFSLPKLSLSTANLYSAVQPGGSLYGLQFSNPVNAAAAYQGKAKRFGKRRDPLRGEKVGGVNVFGGGLALYTPEGELVGAIGVSGDSSCADHNIAWKLRHALNLDNVPGGVSLTEDDNIVYDIQGGGSKSGWGHPECSADAARIARELPKTHPIGPEK